MRRLGLLIAGTFLATGAGLAMTAPASAAGRSGGDHHWDCDHGHSYYYDTITTTITTTATTTTTTAASGSGSVSASAVDRADR